jgi:hypothetical protein
MVMANSTGDWQAHINRLVSHRYSQEQTWQVMQVGDASLSPEDASR